MNFALDSHVLISQWIPGFVFVMAVRPLLGNSSPVLKGLIGLDSAGQAISTLAIVVTAFVVGQVLDALRDLLEHLWDRRHPINWDFFLNAVKDKVDQLKASHFNYYVFDCNMSIGLVILLAITFFSHSGGALWLRITLCLLIVLFAANATSLRREMAPLMKDTGGQAE